MEGWKETSPRGHREAKHTDRRRSDELYRMAARYARARVIARRMPGFEEECEKLETAFVRALYNTVVGGSR